jgi:hypothetical protein
MTSEEQGDILFLFFRNKKDICRHGAAVGSQAARTRTGCLRKPGTLVGIDGQQAKEFIVNMSKGCD